MAQRRRKPGRKWLSESRVHLAGSMAAARLLISFGGERLRKKRNKTGSTERQHVVISEELRFLLFDPVFGVVVGGTMR